MKSIHTTRQEKLCMPLRHARKKADLTQEELSERLGNYKTYVSKYESGERRLDTLEFMEVAEALDDDPASIVSEVMKI
ncbi:helix-turn-helix domain-containing protein [Microvirga sp. 2TAF3]|uniref:helix-turn-helix domain-containing protein n=1 Tax=Microvirga sp. 2TAF3 TaxID=3233014 RepID=UPI003F965131